MTTFIFSCESDRSLAHDKCGLNVVARVFWMLTSGDAGLGCDYVMACVLISMNDA